MSAAARAATATGAGCCGALLMVAAAVTALATTDLGPWALLLGGSATASSAARIDIPPAMLTLYQQAAATCPGLPWTVLAAVGKVESDHGRARYQVSSAGAVGPMQFLPATFAAYDHPVPPGGANPPTPWDPVDAVHAAARYLCAGGARNGRDVPGAVQTYSGGSTAYRDHVLSIAVTYAAVSTPASSKAAAALAYARTQLGVPYVWGGTAPGRAWDCSGLTQAAYAAAGIRLPRTAQEQYDHGPQLPPGSTVQPGDLLFYGTDAHNIDHVGLYAGDGLLLNAPHPGTVVRYEPWPRVGHFVGATRPR